MVKYEKQSREWQGIRCRWVFLLGFAQPSSGYGWLWCVKWHWAWGLGVNGLTSDHVRGQGVVRAAGVCQATARTEALGMMRKPCYRWEEIGGKKLNKKQADRLKLYEGERISNAALVRVTAVCLCVWERKREREGGRDRRTDRHRKRDRDLWLEKNKCFLHMWLDSLTQAAN